MCDDTTEAENGEYLNNPRFKRRDVGIGASAVLATLVTGCASPPLAGAPPPPPAREPTANPKVAVHVPQTTSAPSESAAPGAASTLSRTVEVATPDGNAEGFFVAPASGKHPGVLMWPDIAGLRAAYMTMATRLASEGYAVLVVNHYYRSSKLPVLTTFAEWRTEEGKAKVTPMKVPLTPEAIASDGASFAAWLDQQPEVDKGKLLASAGYCMTGSFAFRTAAAAPDRVGAIASFHGGGLVADGPTSPHALFSRMKVGALICVAENDDEREPQTKTVLAQAAEAAHVPAEIEVYPAQHGWCCIDSPVYDETQAERAWARMLATFERYL